MGLTIQTTELAQSLHQAELAGFLVTWSNACTPQNYEQVLQMWNGGPEAFSVPVHERRVRPGLPPAYPVVVKRS